MRLLRSRSSSNNNSLCRNYLWCLRPFELKLLPLTWLWSLEFVSNLLEVIVCKDIILDLLRPIIIHTHLHLLFSTDHILLLTPLLRMPPDQIIDTEMLPLLFFQVKLCYIAAVDPLYLVMGSFIFLNPCD